MTLLLLCGACQGPSESTQSSSAATQSASSMDSNAKSVAQKSGTPLKVKVEKPAAKPAASPQAMAKVEKSTPVSTIQLVSSPAFQQGMDKSESAASISASAQSPEDWQLVENQWKEAIALMKQVPPNDTNRKAAAQEIARMEAGLDRSQEKLDRLKNNKSGSAIASGPVSEPRRGIYRAAIKRYAGGIPVVDVTFNGRESFEMMVDTGASGTMITEGMAQQLRVKSVGSVEAMTPSGRTQFNVGYIESMSVGGGSIQSFPVAIGPVALLGHDFFGDCNISIKRDQNIVEFSQCRS
jgi:gag-polyprotein putative aspartyl protease